MGNIFRREAGFYRRLLALAIPILIQNLITNSLGLVDTFMVGTLGEEQLAGVTLANTPVFIIQMIMFGIQSGSSVLMSQYWGRQDKKAIHNIMGIGMYLAGAVSLAFALIMSLQPYKFMGLFGNDAEVIEVAAKYARIVGWSYFLDSFVQVYIGAHRSMGKANRGLCILSVSMGCNTFLNWVLIFGKFGVPQMGVQGAAAATLAARLISFIIMVVWMIRDREFQLQLSALLRPSKIMVRQFIRFAVPVVCNETLWGLGTSLLPTIMGHMDGSKEILAAYAIAGNITNLVTAGIFAISGTAAIVIGQQIGLGNKEKVQNLGALLDILAFLFGLLIGAAFILVLYFAFVPYLYPFFSLSAEAEKICTLMLTVTFALMPLRSFDTTNVVGVLRGGGDVQAATLIDLIPLWAVSVPLAALAGLVFHLGILWVYLATASEQLIKFVIGMIRFRSGRWVRDVTRMKLE